jgi:hypothetical protein
MAVRLDFTPDLTPDQCANQIISAFNNDISLSVEQTIAILRALSVNAKDAADNWQRHLDRSNEPEPSQTIATGFIPDDKHPFRHNPGGSY